MYLLYPSAFQACEVTSLENSQWTKGEASLEARTKAGLG
jgi:hypothetical protein